MPRFTPPQLTSLALQALEEAVRDCRNAPLKPSAGLRFTLAYLANTIEDRKPFDDFWRAVTNRYEDENPTMIGAMRGSAADGALHRIYLALGLERVR